MDRFWAKVKRGRSHECWEWTAATTNGYGMFGANGKVIQAHRYAYQLLKGPLKPGHFICHTCDNRSCVNPRHLVQALPEDNVADAVLKGRVRESFLPRSKRAC